MNPLPLVTSALVVLLFSGCQFVSHEATLNPDVEYKISNIGSGVSLSVHVDDERPTEALGKRQALGAKITTSQNIAELVRDEILKGLNAKSFTTIEYSKDNPVRVDGELRLFEYAT